MRSKKLSWILWSSLISLVAFFILLLVLNILSGYIDNKILDLITGILNRNSGFIVISTVLFLFGELFHYQKFPIDLPAPIFNAFGSLIIVKIVISILTELSPLIGLNLNIFKWLFMIIYPVVFIGVLIGGYVAIFGKAIKQNKSTISTAKRKLRHTHDLLDEYANRKKTVKKRRH